MADYFNQVYENEEYYTSMHEKSWKVDAYSLICSLIAAWTVIIVVIILKHTDDIMDVFCRG